MSELYEGVVVRGERSAVREAFDSLRSPLKLRLVRLADSVFGVYRVAGRADSFAEEAMLTAARQLATRLDRALAVFYDNGSGVRIAALVDQTGLLEFGEDDELWVPLDERGLPMRNEAPRRMAELDPQGEYDCITSAIDLGLEGLGVRASVSPDLLKSALCYEEHGWEAER